GSSRPVGCCTRRAQARPPLRAAGVSDWFSWYHSSPVPGSETEPHAKGEASRQCEAERVDAFAKVGFDAVQVGAGRAASVFIQLGIDAGVRRPEHEIPHRGLDRYVTQPEPSTRPRGWHVVG